MAADTSATIGSLLRSARIRAGLTQKDAARKAELSAPTLCKVYKLDIGSVVQPTATKEG